MGAQLLDRPSDGAAAPPAEAPARPWKTLVRVAAASALFVTAFADALPTDRVLATRDTLRLYFPLAQFWIDEVRQGRFPTWWPHDGVGTSLVGGGVAAVLSPMHALAFALPVDQALKWQILLGYLIAALGAGRLARALGADEPGAWFAAVCFGGCGYLLSESDNLIYQQTPAFLPWALLAAYRLGRTRRAVDVGLLALALALMMWSGDVQGTLGACLATLLLTASLARGRGALLWAASICLLVMFCAPLVPAMRATALESGRQSFGYALETAQQWSLHPIRMFELLFGTPYPMADYWLYAEELAQPLGAPAQTALFSVSVTVGTLAAIGTAAVATRRSAWSRPVFILGAMGFVGLWLALGKFGGLYSIFLRYIPLWKSFRYPQKLVVFPSLSLAVLGGLGLQLFAKPTRATWLLLTTFGVLALAMLLSATDAHLGSIFAIDAIHQRELLEDLVLGTKTRATVVLLMIVGLALITWRRPEWASWTGAALGIAQVLWLSSGVVVWSDRELVLRRPVLADRVLAAAAPNSPRICNGQLPYLDTELANMTGQQRELYVDLETLAADQASRFGIGNIMGYTPAQSGALELTCGLSPACGSPCARRMAAQWGVVPQNELERLPAGVRPVMGLGLPRAVLVHDEWARPLVSVPGARFVHSFEALQEGVRSPSEGMPPIYIFGNAGELPADPHPVDFQRPRPDRIEAKLDLTKPNVAVVAELASNGWHANLDGRPVPIQRVDLGLMGIDVPAGVHSLIVNYRPPGWPWVWLAYAVAWLAVLACLVVPRLRRRGLNDSPTPP